MEFCGGGSLQDIYNGKSGDWHSKTVDWRPPNGISRDVVTCCDGDFSCSNGSLG